jgi:hypothetical protein
LFRYPAIGYVLHLLLGEEFGEVLPYGSAESAEGTCFGTRAEDAYTRDSREGSLENRFGLTEKGLDEAIALPFRCVLARLEARPERVEKFATVSRQMTKLKTAKVIELLNFREIAVPDLRPLERAANQSEH